MNPTRKLLVSLWRELYQTETSAALHCGREADRYGGEPPGVAMRDIAKDADGVLKELPGLSARHKLPESQAGKGVGATFSALRRWIFDHLLHRERSYRGTLLGLRHGIDLVRLVGHLADELGEVELSVWCDQWLERRLGRIEAAEEQLAWFARHAETAAEAV